MGFLAWRAVLRPQPNVLPAPPMETSRTILIRPSKDDYDDVRSLHMHKEVSQYLGGPSDPEQFDAYFQKVLHPTPPNSYWVVKQKDTDVFMGFVVIDLHHDKKYYEMSYQFLPEFWGQGYATEACSRVLTYAFNDLGLDAVISETQARNEQSIKLLQRLGMTLDSTLERFGEQQVIYMIKRAMHKSNPEIRNTSS